MFNVAMLSVFQQKLLAYLQIFGCIIHIVVFTISFLTTCTLIGLLFTRLFFIPLMYAVWFIYDKDTPYKGGRLFAPMRQLLIWRLLADYFPVRLYKTEDLDPSGNYIFAAHPHGHFGHGYYCTFVTDALNFNELFPGIHRHVLTVDSFFNWPFLREFILLFGGGSVKSNSIEYKLTQLGPGHSVYICVGGVDEMFLADKSDYHISILKRKGFIRLALKTGASVVPVFQFGETRQYNTADLKKGSFPYWFKLFLEKTWKIKLPYIRGKLSALIPLGRPINHVVGRPLTFDKTELASLCSTESEMVDLCHSRYLEALRKLFEENKARFDEGDKRLIFT